jgi:hypothetical protein
MYSLIILYYYLYCFAFLATRYFFTQSLNLYFFLVNNSIFGYFFLNPQLKILFIHFNLLFIFLTILIPYYYFKYFHFL